MDGFAAFGFGIWFGLTAPLVIHVVARFMSAHARHLNPSRQEIVFIRVWRFLGFPLLTLGLLGVASVVGQTRDYGNVSALGMLIGLAAYGLLFLLHRRMERRENPKVLSDRDIWLSRWEMVRAAGRNTFLMQHIVMGCTLGLSASLILYAVGPRVGSTNIGELPWVLAEFAFFPLVLALYALRTWNVSERMFHALRNDAST